MGASNIYLHDNQEMIAVCRLRQRTKNLHSDELECAAGWEEIEMSRLLLIRLLACAFAVIVYNFVYNAAYVWPICLASHGVEHASFCRVSS